MIINYGINISEQKPEDTDSINILNSLYSKKGSLKFIIEITDDDCHILQGLVYELESIFLTILYLFEIIGTVYI